MFETGICHCRVFFTQAVSAVSPKCFAKMLLLLYLLMYFHVRLRVEQWIMLSAGAGWRFTTGLLQRNNANTWTIYTT